MSWVMMVLASSFDSSSFCVHIHCAHMYPLLLKIKEGNINNKKKIINSFGCYFNVVIIIF